MRWMKDGVLTFFGGKLPKLVHKQFVSMSNIFLLWFCKCSTLCSYIYNNSWYWYPAYNKFRSSSTLTSVPKIRVRKSNWNYYSYISTAAVQPLTKIGTSYYRNTKSKINLPRNLWWWCWIWWLQRHLPSCDN